MAKVNIKNTFQSSCKYPFNVQENSNAYKLTHEVYYKIQNPATRSCPLTDGIGLVCPSKV